MCDSLVSEDAFTPVYWLDGYKTERICDNAVDDCLTTFKFIIKI